MRFRFPSLLTMILLLVVCLAACGDAATATIAITQPAAATAAAKDTVKPTVIPTPVSTTATTTTTKVVQYLPPYGCLPAITIMETVVQACMDKPSPNQNDTLMITTRMSMAGAPVVVGTPIKTIWNYKSGKVECATTSNAEGIGFCQKNIAKAEVGFRVVVEVQYDYKSLGYRGETSFTPVGTAAVAPATNPK